MFSFANFAVPSILAVISIKKALFFSSFLHLVCYLIFFWPVRYGLEIAHLIMGFAAAVLWTAQGACLIQNSNSKTIDRNTGMFWTIYELGLVLGSTYFFIAFQGVEEIQQQKRFLTYGVLLAINLAGCLSLLFLKANKQEKIIDKQEKSADLSLNSEKIHDGGMIVALRRCLAMFKTKKMILIIVASFYTGLEQSFFNAIYPAAVAATKHFGADSVKLIGLYGIFNGGGEMCGGLFFGWLGGNLSFVQRSRSRIFFLAFLIHIASYLLIFLNHPNESTVCDTYGASGAFGWLEPRIAVAILCGFLLGLGDAIFSTQIIALIGTIYNEDPIETSSAFSIYKFCHSIAASITFLYAAFDPTLVVHLGILILFSFFSVYAFYRVEKVVKKEQQIGM